MIICYDVKFLKLLFDPKFKKVTSTQKHVKFVPELTGYNFVKCIN